MQYNPDLLVPSEIIMDIVKTDRQVKYKSRSGDTAKNWKEIRLAFDRYITGSLKSQTRTKCTSGNEIRYHIAHDTNIANILLKQLLSHIKTKQQLTVYLSECVISEFEWLCIDYVVNVMIQSANKSGRFTHRSFASFTWRSRYNLNYALLGNTCHFEMR